MREWAVSSGVVSRSLWVWACWIHRRHGRRIGVSAVRSGDGCAPWLVGTRVSPAPAPMWGEAVRCLGIHPPRTSVVGMERYGHSNSWAHSHASTRTSGGVMPDIELATVAVSEPHAASFKQRISPSRSP